MLLHTYANKKVLITGNTGFKGSWLACWLHLLGARIIGISKDKTGNPSNYDVTKQEKFVDCRFGDVRDLAFLQKIIEETQPDFIFHLAAQALVKESYESPLDTFTTNTLGSLNILEAARKLSKSVVVIMITSDKAYDNVEWKWGYRENDALGGKDPYSASKGMAELGIRSYVDSFFSDQNDQIRVATARAGNVIGGGDWAQDRIIPDCVRSWSKKKVVKVRNPKATRPWQHVLEPLSGYLSLGAFLNKDSSLHGEAYNFGPPADQDYSVGELIDEMRKHWVNVEWQKVDILDPKQKEAGLLKLNCDKALFDLEWKPTLRFEDTVKLTAEWYRLYYVDQHQNIDTLCFRQIEEYMDIAVNRRIGWALDD